MPVIQSNSSIQLSTMEIAEIINDKLIKPKEKTELLSKLLLESTIRIDQMIAYAGNAKDPIKATCIESIEFATRMKPELATVECLDFVTKSLTEKAPRIKWESAKVIGNIAHLFPEKLAPAIRNLFENTTHPGTVVRWSAAFALGQIILLNKTWNEELIPAAEAIIHSEEKNSIKKFYQSALKKVKK